MGWGSSSYVGGLSCQVDVFSRLCLRGTRLPRCHSTQRHARLWRRAYRNQLKFIPLRRGIYSLHIHREFYPYIVNFTQSNLHFLFDYSRMDAQILILFLSLYFRCLNGYINHCPLTFIATLRIVLVLKWFERVFVNSKCSDFLSFCMFAMPGLGLCTIWFSTKT